MVPGGSQQGRAEPRARRGRFVLNSGPAPGEPGQTMRGLCSGARSPCLAAGGSAVWQARAQLGRTWLPLTRAKASHPLTAPSWAEPQLPTGAAVAPPAGGAALRLRVPAPPGSVSRTPRFHVQHPQALSRHPQAPCLAPSGPVPARAPARSRPLAPPGPRLLPSSPPAAASARLLLQVQTG